jgi:hypothetical protein
LDQPEVMVSDAKNRPVRAKMLVDPAGRHVLSPEGYPLLVSEDFDIDRAIAFGRSLRNLPPPEKFARMALAFWRGGPLDLQRSYGGGSGEFVKAFRPAASYLLGVVGRAADFSPETIIAGGGLHNLGAWATGGNVNTSGPWGNAPPNVPWIEKGIEDHDSGRFLSLPGNRAETDLPPIDTASKIAPNAPDDRVVDQDSTEQGQTQIPTTSGTADPQPLNRQLALAGQAGGPWQAPSASGLPQRVIDTGNLLRANGYEITPRTMYVSHVLGPQAAVDLFKRTGSTASDAVPSPDAATGDQMRAWARQLRLGPAALAGAAGGMAPAPNMGPAMPDQSNEDPLAPNQPVA